jgi:hypothetical protein
MSCHAQSSESQNLLGKKVKIDKLNKKKKLKSKKSLLSLVWSARGILFL